MEHYVLYAYDPASKGYGIWKLSNLFNFHRIVPLTNKKQLTACYTLLPNEITNQWEVR